MADSRTGAHDPWQELAAQERARLLAALGHVTEGGIVEDIQHVGVTSLPDLSGTAPIDLALAVWPFPLEPEPQAALEALGYHLIAAASGSQEQRFSHRQGTYRLSIGESGGDLCLNHLLIRDYLRGDEGARQRYAAHLGAWASRASDAPNGENSESGELLAAAQAWWIDRQGFRPVEAVVRELDGYAQPWCISSGWALDLFLGQVTRVHHDVDVVVGRDDQLALQPYLAERGWKLFVPVEGQLRPWPVPMHLERPSHQIHAHREGRFVDFLLTDMAHGVWTYRRHPTVIRSLAQAILRTAAGMPFLAPELVLLFKSKNTGKRERPQDQADFERVHPRLQPEARAWLRWALVHTDPAHPWIERLA